ncbi:invasion associated locus B family protein [Phyllobacterium sp. YR531]|uniref:invasion associated locus B family protein n=1 Tax=Phyllobacterium sp. YR531 TaxID=1144343 RepID=UPI00026F75A2|nr:invasion associated locus B family protein [Phyllobacterium sp. YR531]EJN01639.1 Invasion protein B, involved in pathogenesis [Phyllobacterium sp. YR531]
MLVIFHGVSGRATPSTKMAHFYKRSWLFILIHICVEVAAFTAPSPGNAAEPLRLATIAKPSEKLPLGDLMRVSRPFGDWTLICDLSISKNKRLCQVEQTVKSDHSALYWRIATSTDNVPVVVMSLPLDFDQNLGLSIHIGSYTARINYNEWVCNTSCIAIVLLNNTFFSKLVNAEKVVVSFQTRIGNINTMVLSMNGFSSAVNAAKEDPFGKRSYSKSK